MSSVRKKDKRKFLHTPTSTALQNRRFTANSSFPNKNVTMICEGKKRSVTKNTFFYNENRVIKQTYMFTFGRKYFN